MKVKPFLLMVCIIILGDACFFHTHPPTMEHVTLSPAATFTLAVPPTPVPATAVPSPASDLLILQGNLKDFILQRTDLPQNAQFFLDYQFSIPNVEVEDKAYLEKTGRLDGMWSHYLRSWSNDTQAPRFLIDYLTLYKTTEGAQLAIINYSPMYDSSAYIEEINPPEIGDLTRAFYSNSPKSSEYQTTYELYFSYRNFVHIIDATGREQNVQPEFVRNIARLLLSKLQASPLINP
jgi:hypothetical protein